MTELRAEGLDFVGRAPRVLRFTATMAVPCQAVFDALSADPSTWTWFPGVRDGGYVGSGRGVGAKREIVALGVRYRETILAWDDPSRYAWRIDESSVPIGNACVEVWDLAEHPGGTEVQWTFAVDPKPVFRLVLVGASAVMGAVFRRAMRNLAARLLQVRSAARG